MSKKHYRVIDILDMSADYLQKQGIENARLNAELLLGHVLKLNRVQLYLNFEKPLQQSEVELQRAFLRRRAAREPIQYILGETEFYSLKFKINPYTLIPRPETELLVETSTELCRQEYSQKTTINIFDIGTGSGNIAIAIAHTIPKSRLIAIDIHPQAIDIARENAENHHVAERINFIQQDIFESSDIKFPEFDVIVSNPPYISEKEMSELPREVKDYEHPESLYGGQDGLKFYRRIAEIANDLLAPEGSIAVEIGATQAEQVKAIFSETTVFRQIIIKKDLNQLDRVIVASR